MMENETTNNSIDITPLLEEIQILNQSTISNGKRLDEISDYLIAKDQEEKEARDTEYLDQKEAKRTEEQSQADINETYTELLTDIRDQVSLTNNIMSGQIFFIGVLFGVVLLSVLWNRFIR